MTASPCSDMQLDAFGAVTFKLPIIALKMHPGASRSPVGDGKGPASDQARLHYGFESEDELEPSVRDRAGHGAGNLAIADQAGDVQSESFLV